MNERAQAGADQALATPKTPAASGAAEFDASLVRGDRLVSEADAAALLGIAQRTLQGWRRRGGGPQFLRLSRRSIRYRRDDLAAWIIARLEGGNR